MADSTRITALPAPTIGVRTSRASTRRMRAASARLGRYRYQKVRLVRAIAQLLPLGRLPLPSRICLWISTTTEARPRGLGPSRGHRRAALDGQVEGGGQQRLGV